MSIRISPEAAWWEFIRSGFKSLTLDGSSSDAELFDPHSNTDDFTVAGVIAPDSESISNRSGVFTKSDTVSGDRSWLVYTEPTGQLGVSVYSTTGASGIKITGELSAGSKSFFCARYNYITDGTSELFLRVNDTSSSISDGAGPVATKTGADVKIANFNGSTIRYFDGKIYWLAYWNRKLTDDETAALADGSILPQQLDPDFYIDFHRAVHLLYETDIPQAWKNREFDFEVKGTPTHGGTSESSVDAMIGYGTVPPDDEKKDGGTVVHPWDATYRAEMSLLSVAKNIPVHPKVSSKDRGIALIFEPRND